MIKEIQYAGYSTEPSDYECSDGQLTTSLNLINEDNQLKPIFQPSVQAVLPENYRVVYIHDTNTFTHYIINSNNVLYWLDGKKITEATDKPVSSTIIAGLLANHELYDFSSSGIYEINAIGNTLVVLTSNGIHHFLWKGKEEGYLYLGTHLPELPISFGLQGEMVKTEDFDILFNGISEGDLWKEFSEDNKTKITGKVLAKVNKFIADKSTNAGKFIYPFLVRYAYRLYDGTLTMHSSPVLMICSSDIAPQVAWSHIHGAKSYDSATLCVMGVLHSLDYAVCQPAQIEVLKKWKDIVRSVDIFISKPIYTYDPNGQCTKFAPVEENDCYCVCKHINQTADKNKYPLMYQVRTFSEMYAFTFDPEKFSYRSARLIIPKRSADQVKADIRSCSQFYFLKSIKLDELTTERTIVEVGKNYLQSLVTRETMTDDYDSHDTLIPRYSFSYNSRLNLANIKKQLYNKFNTGALFNYSNGFISEKPEVNNVENRTFFITVSFYIKQDGRDIIVEGESFPLPRKSYFLFLFYPNINAYKAVIDGGVFSTIRFEVPLEAHGFLNGAFYFGGWENPTQRISKDPRASSDEERTVSIPNKIYTSQVNNPFHFPVLGINAVGTGTILGISAAAKALSQGQFGQFPLYAFTTEGVWALEVSNTGSYSARQPITRDVCINPKSITQIDSSVLFATDKGIMLISGSQTQCVSDDIATEVPFDVTMLPNMDQLQSMIGLAGGSYLPIKPFHEFLTGCQMIYDYIHQRIFAFNPTTDDKGRPCYPYAYVFSLKSKLWGMMVSNLQTTINSYPEALAMTNDNKLVSFSNTDEKECKGLYITRPLKLDATNIHKTISSLIQRGHFQRGDVGTILYGSRDLYNWHFIWSSKDHYLRGFRGTPYKYFRIAGIASLTDGKSIFGTSIDFEQRHTNQIR
jgi:hypothetical protein